MALKEMTAAAMIGFGVDGCVASGSLIDVLIIYSLPPIPTSLFFVNEKLSHILLNLLFRSSSSTSMIFASGALAALPVFQHGIQLRA